MSDIEIIFFMSSGLALRVVRQGDHLGPLIFCDPNIFYYIYLSYKYYEARLMTQKAYWRSGCSLFNFKT